MHFRSSYGTSRIGLFLSMVVPLLFASACAPGAEAPSPGGGGGRPAGGTGGTGGDGGTSGAGGSGGTGGAGGSGGGATCAPPLTDCGGSCVDSQTDAANCGSCGSSCAANEICAGGSCELATGCSAGEMLCDGLCAACPADALDGGRVCLGASCVAHSCNEGFWPCEGNCCAWSPETLEASASIERGDIAVDAAGNPHICFFNGSDTPSISTLRYAWRSNGGVWNYETISTSAHEFAGCSLAVDGNGAVHVAFIKGEFDSTMYAVRGSSWSTSVVDGSGRNAVLTLDSSGQPIIVEEARAELKLLRRSGETWTSTVLQEGGAPQPLDVVVDGANIGVLYSEYGTTLKLGTFSGGVFTSELVDTGAMSSMTSAKSLAMRGGEVLVGADGKIHARSGGTWSTKYDLGGLRSHVDVAFLPGGERVAVTELAHEVIYFQDFDGEWRGSIVGAGDEARLAIDVSGKPQLVFAGNPGRAITYAH